jgi:glyoxylase-like metal-dependent hydrolase (beta-lactamase superfamily II)
MNAAGRDATGSPRRARVERLVIPGQYRLGETVRDVENNVWIVGDDLECVVIDAAHDEDLIAAEVGARTVLAILCTHGHNDHVNAAPALAHYTGAPILLHAADRVLWDGVHPGLVPGPLPEVFAVAGVTLRVLSTPGHTPGSVSFHSPELGVVFAGDTAPSALPGLPGGTTALPGHGEATTAAAGALAATRGPSPLAPSETL